MLSIAKRSMPSTFSTFVILSYTAFRLRGGIAGRVSVRRSTALEQLRGGDDVMDETVHVPKSFRARCPTSEDDQPKAGDRFGDSLDTRRLEERSLRPSRFIPNP